MRGEAEGGCDVALVGGCFFVKVLCKIGRRLVFSNRCDAALVGG